jgi:FkbM family methyltransferase
MKWEPHQVYRLNGECYIMRRGCTGTMESTDLKGFCGRGVVGESLQCPSACPAENTDILFGPVDVARRQRSGGADDRCATLESAASQTKMMRSHVSGASLFYVQEPARWQKEFVFRTKSHEAAANLKLKQLLDRCPDGNVIVETGGHVGDTTLWMSEYLRSKRIQSRLVTFEPDVSKMCYIRANLAANGLSSYAEVRNMGLADSVGSGALHKGPHAGGWDVKIGASAGAADHTIRLSTLDVELGTAQPIYLMKIDVEGLEVSVLKGAARLMQQQRPLVMVESCDVQLRSKGTTAAKLRELFGTMQYEQLWIDGTRPAENTDILFGPVAVNR